MECFDISVAESDSNAFGWPEVYFELEGICKKLI